MGALTYLYFDEVNKGSAAVLVFRVVGVAVFLPVSVSTTTPVVVAGYVLY